MSLSKPELEQIKTLGKEFQKCLREGQTPRIEDFLKKVTLDARENLFSILLQIELRIMERNGQSPSSFEFIKRFPNYAGLIRQAFFESTQMSMSDEHRPTLDTDESVLTKAFGLPNSSRLGEYELIRQLGRGGFGVVYEARHLTRQNVVALKTLPAASEGHEVNADRLHKFRKEFRSLSEYNHPNLVGMQTLEVDDGNWFFTMDLIEGTDFLSFVRPNNELNENRLRKSIAQLAIGIIALHEQGIVHRDLKPSNVMVETNGQVKILDFGLVAELQTATDQTASLRSAQFAGTPRYAAPEQMFGDRTEATDWYAFGVMLFEALTSEAPFKGNQMELLRQKQNDAPPLLFGREGVSEDLAQLADSLLNREPQERIVATEIIKLLQLDLETRTFGSKTALGSAGSYGSTGSIDEVDNLDLNWEEEEIELIGREEQLAQLNSAKQELLDKREPVVVFIKGLSGEGKSSLAEKFLRPLRRGEQMLVLSGRCYDRESVPFKVIDSIIEPLVRFLRSQPREESNAILPDDIGMLAKLFPLLRRVGGIAQRFDNTNFNVDHKQIRYRAFVALRELFVSISQSTPTVIFVDDLQWGDADSSKVMTNLLTPPHSPALMLLGTFRSDEAHESPFLADWLAPTEINNSVRCREISVYPLNEKQCRQMLTERLGEANIERFGSADEFIKDTHGNPYFVEQLIESFSEENGQGQHFSFDGVLERKLSRLPTNATDLILRIAIAGQAIRISELWNLVNQDSSLMATLSHMRSERLIRLIGSGDIQLVDTYHDKVRESALRNTDPDIRMQIHLQFAETIENETGISESLVSEYLASDFAESDQISFDTSRISDLAYHLSSAEDPRAFTYQLMAGELSCLAYAADDAIGYLRKAKALHSTSVSGSALARLFYRLGVSYAHLLKVSKALAAFETAIGNAPSSFALAHVYARMAEVHQTRSQYKLATKYHDLALEQIGRKRPRSLMAHLRAAFIFAKLVCLPASWWRTDRNEKIVAFEQSIYMHIVQYKFDQPVPLIDYPYAVTRVGELSLRSSDPDTIASGMAFFAAHASVSGLPRFGRAMTRLGTKYFNEMTDTEKRGICLYGSAVSRSVGNLKALEQADRDFIISIPLLIESGSHMQASTSIHMRRHLHEYFGGARPEQKLGSQLIDHARKIGDLRGQCWGHYDLAAGLARAGKISEAMIEIRKAGVILESTELHLTAGIFLAQQAFIFLQASDFEGARLSALQGWRLVKKRKLVMEWPLKSLPLVIESAVGPLWLGSPFAVDVNDLKRKCRIAWLLTLFYPKLRSIMHRVRGRALWAIGRRNKALVEFEKAVSIEKIKTRFDHAKSLLDLAAVKEEGREQNRSEAIALLKKMESVIPRAESWLLGDQYDEAVVAPEFDLDAWEKEHGPITPYLNEEEATIGLDTMKT